MKTYSLGEVIDSMKFGEVAIKVAGVIEEGKLPEDQIELELGLYYDEDDGGILKTLGEERIYITSPENDEQEYRLVIFDREVYERIKST